MDSSRFQNPIRQNYGHVKTLQALLSVAPDAIVPLVVFTGDAEFKTNLGPTVIKLPELITHLSESRPTIFDPKAMACLIGRIEMARRRRSLESDEYHLNPVPRRVRSSKA